MRSIEVTTDVFAALWTARKPGQDSENDIIAGLLGLAASGDAASNGHGTGAFDRESGIRFPEGFRIFRTDRDEPLEAWARGGSWHLGDGRRFTSLKRLNEGIDATDSAWVGWHYARSDGSPARIGELGDPDWVKQPNYR